MNDMASKNDQPWKTENWFVSPWNYLDEVREGFAPPKQVKIHDITLRDGEQQAGIIFTKDDKIRIAEKLSEVGIHRIETGMPAVSPNDEAAIREIVKRNLDAQIFCFCRCMVDDVKLAADCGVDGIVIEIPTSKHLLEQGYKWPLEKAVDLSIKALLAPPASPEPEVVQRVEPQSQGAPDNEGEPAPTAMALAYAAFQDEKDVEDTKKESSKAKRPQEEELDAIITRTLAASDQ